MSEGKDEETLGDQLSALRPAVGYARTRRLIVRSIGFIYFVAFFSLSVQVLPLFGRDGLLPVVAHLAWISEAIPNRVDAFLQLPSIFWFHASDGFLQVSSVMGAAVSLAVLAGFGNVPLLFFLWALYLSFVHIGQIFYGYGWEYLLLEAGLLSIFLVPFWRRGLNGKNEPGRMSTLLAVILFRWLTFRLMLGAGLIKIRGDACWTDLTCLVTHYETQPNPHPLSWVLHHAPAWFHQAGVLFNHFVELVVPFLVFGPRKARLFAGTLIIAFQLSLISSGNLSFLNWLTIVIAMSCFDDDFLRLLLEKWRKLLKLPAVAPSRVASTLTLGSLAPHQKFRLGLTITWALIVAALSLDPLENLLGTRQKMNASYNRLHLVNSYGAFGTVHQKRHEIIIEGTADAPGPHAKWKAYEFPCKPGRLDRPPCFVTPYHHRLQWQMWFASFSGPHEQPWLPHLVYKLLHGSSSVLPLLETNPFPNDPPRAIRIRLFEYEFADWGSTDWWRRSYVGQWMRPVERGDAELVQFLRAHRFPISE